MCKFSFLVEFVTDIHGLDYHNNGRCLLCVKLSRISPSVISLYGRNHGDRNPPFDMENGHISADDYHICPRVTGPNSQIAKFMGPTWVPPGSCRTQMGPMLAPWTCCQGMLSSDCTISRHNDLKYKSYLLKWCLIMHPSIKASKSQIAKFMGPTWGPSGADILALRDIMYLGYLSVCQFISSSVMACHCKSWNS